MNHQLSPENKQNLAWELNDWNTTMDHWQGSIQQENAGRIVVLITTPETDINRIDTYQI